MESDVGVCYCACVVISRSEFRQLAKQYGVWNAPKTCNIRFSRSDFDNAQIEKNNGNIVESITLNLSRSDFSYSAQALHQQEESFETMDVFSISDSYSSLEFEIKSKSDIDCTKPEAESTERYQFRSRKRAIENAVCSQPKRIRAVVRANTKVPKLVIASKDILSEGVVVLAKMRTYAAWPARIKTFRKTCVNVEFFGEETNGNVPYSDIGLFQHNHQLIIFNLQKKIKGYRKSVQCAEGTMEIPTHLSILNNV